MAKVDDIKVGKRLLACVAAAERRYDVALNRANKARSRALAPFAEQAAAFETAMKEANAQLEADMAPYRGSGLVSPQSVQADPAAREAQMNAVKAIHAAHAERLVAVNAAFAPYEAPYRQANALHQMAKSNAAGLLELRFQQLFGHINLDLHIAEMRKRFER